MALNNLIYHLNKSSLKQCLPILNALSNFNYMDNLDNTPYNEKNYRKFLLYQNKKFDIYLIDWKEKSESYIHNHPNNGCIFKILNGKIEEEIYSKKLDFVKTNSYFINDCGYIDDSLGYHKMKNLNNTNTFSLHIYSPPNYKMTNFN